VRVLVDGEKEPGLHRAEWDGLDSHGKKLPTGVYFAAISTNTESAATPLILIR
jgi:flagellar hook assembly protein FlgD